MKEELRGFLRSLQDRNKNRDEFVAFLPESRERFWCDDLSIDEQFKPVGGFFKLAQRIATLRDKLRLASRAPPTRLDGCKKRSNLGKMLRARAR
jgi:hypothetical protein